MKKEKLVLYILSLLITSDIIFYIGIAGFQLSFFPTILLICSYICVFIAIGVARQTKWRQGIPWLIIVVYELLLAWNIESIIHGVFTAQGYWDWKFLFFSSILSMLVPLAFFMGKNLFLARQSFYYYIKYVFLYGFLLLPLIKFTNEEVYARIMIPIPFILLFVPYVKTKYKILIIVVAFISLLSALEYRTNIIKIAISLAVLSTFYVRFFFGSFFLKLGQIFFFVLPTTLLFLGVTGQFNVFEKMSENQGVEVQTNDNTGADMAADTRTGLYQEVFENSETKNSWLFGEGACGKYKSAMFTELATGNMRQSCEVSFLNSLLYSGIIGVVLYFLLLLFCSYYAIYKSNNFLCKMLGLIIASKWLLYFVEDLSLFNLNFYFIWLTIGLISSNKFRNMSDSSIKRFFQFEGKRPKHNVAVVEVYAPI